MSIVLQDYKYYNLRMQNLLASIMPVLQPWLILFAENPMLRIGQVVLIVVGLLLIFLVFYTTRDIILRTHSFIYMLFCILLVALFPLVGFLLYILIRPARTVKQRDLDRMMQTILEGIAQKQVQKKAPKKKVVKVKNQQT